MDSDRLDRWLSLAANLGLLAGLILVAVEINQSSDLARMQLINEGNVALNQVWATFMGENPSESVARSIESPDEMTFAEFLVVDTYLFTSMNLFYRNYELAREGIFDDHDWQKPIDTYAAWFLGSRFGRAWWSEEARHFFAPEFVAYVDQTLENVSGRNSESYWLGIKARLIRE